MQNSKMSKLNLASQYQSLCSSIQGHHTPRSGTPWGTVLSTADQSQSDCSFSAAEPREPSLHQRGAPDLSEQSLFTPRSRSMGTSQRVFTPDLQHARTADSNLRPRCMRYTETTTVRSTSCSKEDGSQPIIQTVLVPLPQTTKPQVQVSRANSRTKTVYPTPLPQLPTCSTSFSKKCWTEWRSTPGPGEYPVQSYKAIGTNNHAHNFGDVYVNGVLIERTSDLVHEKLERERRRPNFYSYSTTKKYDSPCYLINPLGERKENRRSQTRDPKLTLRDIRCHEGIRLRDIMRQKAAKDMGVTF